MVVRHFPLDFHEFARDAAVAAECAAAQNRFEEFHDILFENQRKLGKTGWAELASNAGVVDTTRFKACLKTGDPAARVEADMALGEDLEVSGTPTIFVNGIHFTGRTKEALVKLVEHTLKPTRPWWRLGVE
jgi:protein-disulfide isomerase